jgi:hypothetical protein
MVSGRVITNRRVTYLKHKDSEGTKLVNAEFSNSQGIWDLNLVLFKAQ